MQLTTNYQLKKQELTDKADITQISDNWDIIDSELFKRLETSGGEVTGDLKVSGELISEASLCGVIDVTKGTNPELQQSWEIGLYDFNGFEVPNNQLGAIQYTAFEDGSAQLSLLVNKYSDTASSLDSANGVIIKYEQDGGSRVNLTHNPIPTSNDTQIATTYWVNSKIATDKEYGLVKLANEDSFVKSNESASIISVPFFHQVNDLRRANTAYFVGDRVACAFNFHLFLECTQAGVTSDSALDTRSVKHGQVINDGSAQWTVRTKAKSVNDILADENGNISLSGGSGESTKLVKQPVISEPAENEQNVSLTPTITASAYFCLIPTETRAYREFQVAVNTGSFSEPVFSKQLNADSVQVIDDESEILLSEHVTYKCRCRDITLNGVQSDWSKTIAFTVGDRAEVVTPSVYCNDGAISVPETPTFTTSEFALSVNTTEDTHLCTTWILVDNDTQSEVWRVDRSSAYKTSLKLSKGILQPQTNYTIKAIHYGTLFGASQAGELEFRTADKFDHIETPTLTITGEPSSVGETPTISGSAFTVVSDGEVSDTHRSTDWMIVKDTTLAVTNAAAAALFLRNGLATLAENDLSLGGIPTLKLNEVVWQSIDDTANKTSITVPKGNLETSTTYTAYARYRGDTLGYSEYATKQFTTKDTFAYVVAPTFNGNGYITSLTSNTFTLGAFTVVDGNDTHESTDWELYENNSLIWSSYDDKSHLTSITINTTLSVSYSYTLKVRFKGTSLGYSTYASKSLTIEPVLKLLGKTITCELETVFYKQVNGSNGYSIGANRSSTSGALTGEPCTMTIKGLQKAIAEHVSTGYLNCSLISSNLGSFIFRSNASSSDLHVTRVSIKTTPNLSSNNQLVGSTSQNTGAIYSFGGANYAYYIFEAKLSGSIKIKGPSGSSINANISGSFGIYGKNHTAYNIGKNTTTKTITIRFNS